MMGVDTYRYGMIQSGFDQMFKKYEYIHILDSRFSKIENALKPSPSSHNSNLTNELRLHQFLGTETTEANKSLKIDANGAH